MKNIETDHSDIDLFELFKRDIESCRPLSSKEEKRCFKIGKAGREKLVLHNLFLVIAIAKEYRNKGLDFLDLIQEGIFGLFKALENFKPEKKVKLSTFAYYCIKQAVIDALLNHSGTIRKTKNAKRDLNKIIKTEKWFCQKNGRWPTNQETAEIIDRSLKQVEEIKIIGNQSKTVSLATPVNSHGQHESQRFLEDFLPDENETSIDDAIYQKEIAIVWQIASQSLGCNNNGRIFSIAAERAKNGEGLSKILERRGIDRLTIPEKKLYILLRRTLDPPDTLEKLGQEFNLTRERIRQMEAQALKSFRHPKWKKEFKRFI